MRRRRVGLAVVAVTAAMAVMPGPASASSICNEGQVNPGDVNQTLRELGKTTGLEHLGNELNETIGYLRRLDGKVPLGKICALLPD